MLTMHELVRRLENLTVLDRVAKPLQDAAKKAVQHPAIRNLLSGTNLGHPLHPPLTDLPVGAWSMAVLLDTVGGRAARPAADALVAAGMIAAVPTAATGLNDWSDTLGREARVGVVHAAANTAALGLFTASLVNRRRGHRSSGRLLGLAGLAVLTVGGYLGGHLGYARGVNVNRTAWHQGPAEWTSVLADADLPEGRARRTEAEGVPILLYRHAGTLYALDSVCSHLGGPLQDGSIDDGRVTCPWHGSTFRLADGRITRGPASAPQPTYDVRVQDGQIQVRAATS